MTPPLNGLVSLSVDVEMETMQVICAWFEAFMQVDMDGRYQEYIHVLSGPVEIGGKRLVVDDG